MSDRPHTSSLVLKRSIVIKGHKTSVSLEDAFYAELRGIAARRGMTISDLVALIDVNRSAGNLSSALRLFVLEEIRKAGAGPQDERRAA